MFRLTTVIGALNLSFVLWYRNKYTSPTCSRKLRHNIPFAECIVCRHCRRMDRDTCSLFLKQNMLKLEVDINSKFLLFFTLYIFFYGV